VNPLRAGAWLGDPVEPAVDGEGVALTTRPGTDLWQRTFYGFRASNAPALVVPVTHSCSLTVRVAFDYRRRYDQAGLLVLLDEDCWAKASIEYEDPEVSRLGSVVTNGGYSDWATRDIPTPRRFWYRLSLRGPDLRFEACADGVHWEQVRVAHLHGLGATTPASAAAPAQGLEVPGVRVGVYACSPEDSSFRARFDRIVLEPSVWEPHA
jgi:regulation of enolase protein 1 (concanavalin A-like superfamily)